MKPTSVEAYRHHIRSGDCLRQQDRVFAYIDAHPGRTRLEIARDTGIAINAVCGRVAKLVEREFVEEGRSRRCRLTGRSAAPLYVREPVRSSVPHQERLPL